MRELVFFGFKQIVRRCCGRFFHWKFISFFKSRIGFQREFYVFGARHCVFIGLFNFLNGCQLILLDPLGIFVITNVFSMSFFIFGGQNCFFNESVCFLVQAVCKAVLCPFFSLVFASLFKSRIGFQGEFYVFWNTALCFHRAVQFFEGAALDSP